MNETDIKKLLLSDVKEDKKTRNMGMGALADSSTVFVRQFRWIFQSENLSEYISKKVDFNREGKQIYLELYEIYNLQGKENVEALDWADFIRSNPGKYGATFATFDGCGNKLYTEIFHGLKIVSQDSNFDYASSETAIQKLALVYNRSERVYGEHEAQIPVFNSEPKKKVSWTIKVADETGTTSELEIKIKNRPNVDIEETEINFLSSKTWLPGKAKWKSFIFQMDRHDFEKIQSRLDCSRNKPTAILGLYSAAGKKLEQWNLHAVWIEHKVPEDNKTVTIALRYDSVKLQVGEQPKVTPVVESLQEVDLQTNKVVKSLCNACKELYGE